LFFSTTDLKGRIHKANRVFERVAAWTWEELKNKPHNIIRHPDMPRIVFRTLWDYIQSGRHIVAYVKNLAHDGRYYWVMAMVSPIPDGYLSVRFKPTSPLRETVEQLYAELRAAEAAIEEESNDRKAAMDASAKLLESSLRRLGFGSYDDFMRHAMKVEMLSREEKLPSAPPADLGTAGHDATAAAALLFDRLVAVLRELCRDLDLYTDLSGRVREKSAIVADVSESLRVSALNGAIEADRLGARAAGLRPVLDWLRGLSAEITHQGRQFSSSLNDLAGEVDQVVFDLACAKLQAEITAFFAHELAVHAVSKPGDAADCMTDGAIAELHSSSCATLNRAVGRLASVRSRLAALSATQMQLIQSSHSLRPVYLTGRIEMAEGVGAGLSSVFRDVGGQMDATSASLEGLGKLLRDLDGHMARGLSHAEDVKGTIADIDSRIGTIY